MGSGELVSRVVNSLRNGEVSVLPMDNRYIFIADAFSHDAIKRIQFLRNTPAGTSLQVCVASMGMAGGIVQKFSPTAVAIAEHFWPGPLTILATPHIMLNWNLGDDGAMDHFALRIPQQEYLRSLISQVGPVVIANANYLGKGAIREIGELDIRQSDVSFIFDAGRFDAIDQVSTVIQDNPEVEIEFIREGAISFAEIRDLLHSKN